MKLVTHYDYDLLKTFFRFSLMRNRKGNSRKTLFFVFSAIGLIGSVLFMVGGRNRAMFTVLAVAILMVDAFVIYQLTTVTKRAYKRNPAMFRAVNEYEFEAKRVVVRSLVDGEKEGYAKYDDLLRAVETPTAFYLYVAEGSAYIISKREIFEEEGEKLAVLLNKKMPGRFFYKKR